MNEARRHNCQPDSFDQLAAGLSEIPVVPERERPQWLRLHEEWSFLERQRQKLKQELTSDWCREDAQLTSSVESRLASVRWQQDALLGQMSKVPEACSIQLERTRRKYRDGYVEDAHHRLILLPNNFSIYEQYEIGRHHHHRVVDAKEASSILEARSAELAKEAEDLLRQKQQVDGALGQLGGA